MTDLYISQNIVQNYIIDSKQVLNNILYKQMGFKANIDIGISFSSLKICSIRQQGSLKFRVCLYHVDENDSIKESRTISCHPYSILRHYQSGKNKHPQRSHSINKNNRKNSQVNESQLDLESEFYLSRSFRVMLDKEAHPILQTCSFRTYVDVQKYPDLNLKCQVQLLFCPYTITQNTGEYKTIGRCYCKIRRLFDVSTYLSIAFDEFEGVVLDGVYHAALMDFHFEKQNEDNHQNSGNSQQHKAQSFYQYLNSTSGGFKRQQTRNFYHYYRKVLQKELFSIQQRHFDILRTSNYPTDDYRIIRMNPNQKIQNTIDQLSGYNSNHNEALYYNKYKNSRYKSNQFQKPYRESMIKKNQSSMDDTTNSNYSELQRKRQQNLHQMSKKQIDMRKHKLAEQIMHDYLSIKAFIFQKWSEFLNFAHQNIPALAIKYKITYDKLVKERLSVNVFSHIVSSYEWKNSAYDHSGRDHLKQAQLEKKKVEKDEELWKQIFVIESQHFFCKESKSIKIFEEIYTVKSERRITSKRFSLRQIDYPDSQNIYTSHSTQNIPPKQFLMKPSNQSFHHGHKLSQQFHYPSQLEHQKSLQMDPIDMSEPMQDLENFQKNPKEDHFVILVHGYQASRQDFLVLKNCLEIRFTHIKVFISTCNEGRTEDSIEVLGKRLAVQIQKYINNSSPSSNYRLSFLGHSMGGLIIRTALCYLDNIDKNLYSFITLSTPHLGYLYEASTHIQAGLWVMKNLQKSQSIEQICMQDGQQLRKCFLYKLSKSGSINKFKNLALIGSVQDKYIAYQSARIQQNQTIILDKLAASTGQIVSEMIDGILGNLECHKLSRMDVIFNIQQSNFDSMIGRTAHIRYLSDKQFIKTFCIVFDKFFK